ncbi:mitotic cohesin complex, non-SMC subunit Rad21 (kleisin) [Dermatophagoides pteronyssinus]|uniref:Mitotic cohesin complex, non-SMC subunit Rad21 (Kleisin) n=2 Tax=Dermatophagoides pteronyssinus TaxID=6956 RepID=A0ABQ8JS27_DERPT|nr:double-strand-break repair protein rad21 homolog [Dermatophagoides pteronyssinus]KAH9425200.1 mitotic cohesin complex, non-SMC subunit Rad21 (kleisin) [Dermatophagoides pteronyssinus]
MFYSVFVLGKKGPLARVWLAAHWDKKITKAQILETNIVESVDSILQPKIKLSLRTSSHLLLGIVRIYSRKALYLLQDCQDAAFKIKSAFRPGVVDLPDGKTEAAISAITLPEMFDFINDFDLMAEPQLHLETTPTTTANIRNITLVEDISSIHVDDPLMMNDVRDWSEIGSIGGGSINIKDSTLDHTSLNDSGISLKNNNNIDLFDRPALDDGFGGQLGVGIVDDVDADDVFNMPMPDNLNKNDLNMENGLDGNKDALNNIENGGQSQHEQPERPHSVMSDASDAESFGVPGSFGGASSPDSTLGDVDPFNSIADNTIVGNQLNNNDDIANDDPNQIIDPKDANQLSQNTMILEPIDPQTGVLDKKRKRRKKIGMVIDEVKTLSGEEMKAQLSDTTDIVTNLDLAPPNKMLMNWKKTGLSDKLFTLPERCISAKALFHYYSRNLITNRYEELNEEDDLLDERNIYPLADGDEFGRHHTLNGDGISDPSMMMMMDPLQPINDDYQQQQPESPQPPRTPRISMKNMQSPAPSQRKRKKMEDKENKDIGISNKRQRENSKYDLNKLNHSGTDAERTSAVIDSSNLLNDNSSIPGFRDHTSNDLHGVDGGSYQMDHIDKNFLPQDQQSDEERDEEEEDDIFDYAAPMSVGPAEEMLPDETIDQYEERIRTKRSNLLLKYMAVQLDDNGHIQFTNLVRNNKRKLVAQKFYALLVLKKQMAIELYQNAEMPYSELNITKGLKYDEHMVSTTVS